MTVERMLALRLALALAMRVRRMMMMMVVVRMVMMVARSVSVAVSVMASLAAPGLAIASFGCDAPEAVAPPGPFLTLLAAVFGSPAATAFGELAGILLPLPAFPICALADATARLVLAAQVAHDNAGPVLHVTLLWRGRRSRSVAG